MARPTHTPEQIDAICRAIGAGATMSEAGAAVGIARNSVSSILFRLRQKNDPRVAPAGPPPTQSKAEQRDAVADAFAAGAVNLQVAAQRAGLTITVAKTRWTEVRARLGRQAQ